MYSDKEKSMQEKYISNAAPSQNIRPLACFTIALALALLLVQKATAAEHFCPADRLKL